MNERLSWKEIQNKYPDMWVGLTDVIYEDDNDKANIVSAIVKYCDKPRDELYLKSLGKTRRLCYSKSIKKCKIG